MANVLIPKGGSGLGGTVSGILPAIGSAFGPIGKVVGTVGGAIVGGMAGNEEKRSQNVADAAMSAAPKDVQAPQAPDVMQRRTQKIEEDPYEQLKAAHQALQNGPKELRQEYGDQLNEALLIAQKQRNMA